MGSTSPGARTPARRRGGWQVLGDPTERAWVVAARKAEVHAHDRDGRVLHEIPFDSERKAMSVLVRGPDDSATMHTKGAPEVVLAEGSLMAAVGGAAFAYTWGRGGDVRRARTAAFCTLAFTQLFFSFACRSRLRTLPELGPLSNPYLFAAVAASCLLQFAVVTLPWARPVFDIPADPGGDWLHILPLALAPVTVVEVAKLVRAGLRGCRARRPVTEP